MYIHIQERKDVLSKLKQEQMETKKQLVSEAIDEAMKQQVCMHECMSVYMHVCSLSMIKQIAFKCSQRPKNENQKFL